MARTPRQQEAPAPFAQENDTFISDLENNGKLAAEFPEPDEAIVLVSAAEFWQFEKDGHYVNPVFQGKFIGEEISREPGNEGEIFAYVFEQSGTRQPWLLGTNYLIETAINDARKITGKQFGFTLWVRFIEKVASKQGRDAKFSRFKILLVKDKAPVETMPETAE